ncbi:hypothetical protein ACFL96_13435 [Thermoproteota archaeon]
MVTERSRHWQLTQERALELYELIQNSLDPSTWEMFIKSENSKMSIGDFLEKARKRIIYQPENSVYAPSVVADDALVIIDSLPAAFDNLRNRLEDSFRSILVVNEDMNNFIEKIEQEADDAHAEADRARVDNQRLTDEIVHLKKELEDKQEGIKPLIDILNIRIKSILAMFQDFKKCLGNEEEMKKFMPIFDKEVEYTEKLVELKRKQILESTPFVPEEVEDESVFEEEDSLPPEEEEETVDDNAVLDGEPELPAELADLDPKFYSEALKLVPNEGEPGCPTREFWLEEMKRCMQTLMAGKKYKLK